MGSSAYPSFLHWLNLFQGCPFLTLAAGDTQVASSPTHCSTVGKLRGSGRELFWHPWRWLVPSLGFSSSSRLISPNDGTPLGLGTVSCREQAAFRLSSQQWGHVQSVQRTQPAFWEADAVGVAYKKPSWERCGQSCGLDESSSAFIVCMRGKSPAALIWTETSGINRKAQGGLLLLEMLGLLMVWGFFQTRQQSDQLEEQPGRVRG